MLGSKHPRVVADCAVVFLHLVSLLPIMISTPDFAKTTQGSILCAMEAVTIVAHAIYLYNYQQYEEYSKWQSLKWAEYGISATLGIFAVAFVSDADVPFNTILLLAAAGVAQQSQGYQLEQYMTKNENYSLLDFNILLSYLVALLLQIGEFAVVALIIKDSPGAGGTEWMVFASYVVGYTLFGQSFHKRAFASFSNMQAL